MKRLVNITLIIIVFAGVLVTNAHAQTQPRVTANIPFAFSVGKATLPAGRYTVTVLNPSSDRKILQIRSMNGRSSAVVLTNGIIGDANEKAKLVFERHGDRYAFAQAHLAGDETTLAAVKSKKKTSMVAIVAE